MPDADALAVPLGDGYELLAAGVARLRSGGLGADLSLRNGVVIHADRIAINVADDRAKWVAAAVA